MRQPIPCSGSELNGLYESTNIPALRCIVLRKTRRTLFGRIGCQPAMQAARRSPRSVAVDEIQQEVGLPHVTAATCAGGHGDSTTHRDRHQGRCADARAFRDAVSCAIVGRRVLIADPACRRLDDPDVVLADNLIRAAHAACWYSWSTPPSRSRRRMSRLAIWSGARSGAGSSWSGRAFAMP